jgi:twitching motility protein PilI
MKPDTASGITPQDGLYRQLAEVEANFRSLATRLPDEAPPAEVWAGVLFKLGKRSFLAPLDQIAEVLEVPGDVTAILGTKPWVLGVANNRGTLLPLFDLTALIYGGAPGRHDSDRVLAVRQSDLPCGLVVSEAVGIRHFEAAGRIEARDVGPEGALDPFVDAAFTLDGTVVAVLALDRLIAAPLLNAGAS